MSKAKAERRVVVVGSGASAVHFAQSALERGWSVVMLDVGRAARPAVEPDLSFDALIKRYQGSTNYFLGERFQSVLYPSDDSEYYGFPPHREYIFEGVDGYKVKPTGFEPLQSFARGGLAEAWTGGSFTFNEQELKDWPFGQDELLPFYGEVADRIGVMGADDDLARFIPVHEHLATPIDLDEHSEKLFSSYQSKRAALNAKGAYMGRSRVAVITEDRDDRKGCTKMGRCLWGCPKDALYTPSMTLRRLMLNERFEYRPGHFVTRFESESSGRITHVVARVMSEGGGTTERIQADRVVLGAGTLASAKIFLDSVYHHSGERWTLDGLMDNRQVLMPFVNLKMIKRQHDPNTYQYHQLAIGLSGALPEEYVHGLVTTLKTTLMHPIVQSVPIDLRTALNIFRNMHAALGLVNINLHDRRRSENQLSLEIDGAHSALRVHYQPDADEPRRIKEAMSRMRSLLMSLGCVVPPGMAHQRPMGASVHYAGVLPMSAESGERRCTASCRSYDFENLWFVDGTTLPFLPAKNVTFTLMANAARVAAADFS